MKKFNIPATLKLVFSNEAPYDGGDSGGAQGVEDRIAAILNGGASNENGDTDTEDDVANLDDKGLPKVDDTETTVEEPEVKEPDADADGDLTLASMLGLDDDKLEYDENNNVVFNAIIDGETHKVPVAELVKSYQLQGHVNNKSIALENDRKGFETTRDQAYNELTVRLQGLNQLIKLNEDSLLAEYQSIDWNTLRMTEPGEWAALQQQFKDRAGQIDQVKQLAGQENQRLTQEQQQQQMQAQQARLSTEFGKMLVDNPTWNDQAVMAKEIGDIGAFLRNTYGFTDQEIADNADARLMRMFKDAMAFRNGTQAIKEKQVPKNVPKFTKPGVASGDRPSLQKAREVKQQKDNIRKSGGSVDSVAAILASRM